MLLCAAPPARRHSDASLTLAVVIAALSLLPGHGAAQQDLVEADEEQCGTNGVRLAIGGGALFLFVFVTMCCFRSCCPTCIRVCGFANRPIQGVSWVWINLMWVIWWLLMIGILIATAVCEGGLLGTVLPLAVVGCLIASLSLAFALCRPYQAKPLWLPIPYDHALRVTTLYTSAGILTFIGLSLRFVTSHRWVAALYAAICIGYFLLLLQPNYVTLKRLDAIHRSYGREFLRRVARPRLFASQFSNIVSWQISILLSVALNLGWFIYEEDTAGSFAVFFLPTVYVISLVTTNEMRLYISTEVGAEQVRRGKLQLPPLPAHIGPRGHSNGNHRGGDGGAGDGPEYSAMHKRNCAIKPAVAGIAATLPFQALQSFFMALSFLYVSIALVRSGFHVYQIGFHLATLLMLWFLYINIQIWRSLTPSAAERRDRDDYIRRLRESVEGGNLNLLSRLGALAQTWRYQQIYALVAHAITLGAAYNAATVFPDLLVDAWAYLVMFAAALGLALSLLTVLGSFVPALEGWNLLQVFAVDMSRRGNTLARGLLFTFNSLLVLQVGIVCECPDACDSAREGARSLLQFAWSLHFLLTVANACRDFRVPLRCWQHINVPWPRLFVVTGVASHLWILIANIVIVSSASTLKLSAAECSAGLELSSQLGTIILTYVAFYGFYLTNEYDRFLDLVYLKGSLDEQNNTDGAQYIATLMSAEGVAAFVPYLTFQTFAVALVLTAADSLLSSLGEGIPDVYIAMMWLYFLVMFFWQLSFTPTYVTTLIADDAAIASAPGAGATGTGVVGVIGPGRASAPPPLASHFSNPTFAMKSQTSNSLLSNGSGIQAPDSRPGSRPGSGFPAQSAMSTMASRQLPPPPSGGLGAGGRGALPTPPGTLPGARGALPAPPGTLPGARAAAPLPRLPISLPQQGSSTDDGFGFGFGDAPPPVPSSARPLPSLPGQLVASSGEMYTDMSGSGGASGGRGGGFGFDAKPAWDCMDISSDEAQRRLQGMPVGAFVVRGSRNPQAFAALTINGTRGAMSYHIFRDGTGLRLNFPDAPVLPNLEVLVENYQDVVEAKDLVSPLNPGALDGSYM